jgi:hypothetical protein
MNGTGHGGLRRLNHRLRLPHCFTPLGLALSAALGIHPKARPRQLTASAAYGDDIAALLVSCLFAISRRELSRNARVVARMDPIAVAATLQNRRMSERARAAREPYLPAAVGLIAIAILVVNVLHTASNGACGLIQDKSSGTRLPSYAATGAATSPHTGFDPAKTRRTRAMTLMSCLPANS